MLEKLVFVERGRKLSSGGQIFGVCNNKSMNEREKITNYVSSAGKHCVCADGTNGAVLRGVSSSKLSNLIAKKEEGMSGHRRLFL